MGKKKTVSKKYLLLHFQIQKAAEDFVLCSIFSEIYNANEY